MKRRVHVLGTGGTIAGAQPDPGHYGYTAAQFGIDWLLNAVPGLDRLATLSGEQVVNIGSQDMDDEQGMTPPLGKLVTRGPSGWLQTSAPDGASTCAIRSSKASAATLCDVVDFQDTGFHIDLSEQQKQDLVAFLAAL